MTEAANRVLEDALKLTEHERAKVSAELLASLEPIDGDVQEAWAREIERRAAEARVSDSDEIDWREALNLRALEAYGAVAGPTREVG